MFLAIVVRPGDPLNCTTGLATGSSRLFGLTSHTQLTRGCIIPKHFSAVDLQRSSGFIRNWEWCSTAQRGCQGMCLQDSLVLHYSGLPSATSRSIYPWALPPWIDDTLPGESSDSVDSFIHGAKQDLCGYQRAGWPPLPTCLPAGSRWQYWLLWLGPAGSWNCQSLGIGLLIL